MWEEISSVFKDPNDPNKEILLPRSFHLMVRQDRNQLKSNYEKEKRIVFKNLYEVTDGDCQEVCCVKNDCDEIDNNKIGENDEFDREDDITIDSEEQTIRDDVLVSDKKREFQIILIPRMGMYQTKRRRNYARRLGRLSNGQSVGENQDPLCLYVR